MMIKRDLNKIPKIKSNPACEMLKDTIEYFNLTQAKAAEQMGVNKGLLCQVVNGRRGVSIDLALRAEALLGISSELLVELQAKYDYQKAYHQKQENYFKIIERLHPSS